MQPLEGLPVNLSRGTRAVARGPIGRAIPRPPRRVLALAVAALVAAALPAVASSTASASVIASTSSAGVIASTASASEAQKIIEKCGHKEPFGGYSQSAYREALKQLPTEVSEYTDCENLIRKDELAAAGGGGGASAPGVSPNVALPLTPSEQRAVQSAHRNGSAPVRVGNEPIRPGVVHADIASVVNTLPRSLVAALAFMLLAALLLVAGEVRKRVRARRDG